MPRPMQRTPRFVTSALLVIALGACTGDEGGGNGDGGRTAETTGPTAATGETAPTPVGITGASETEATYEYANAGLRVVMDIADGTGTIEVENGTDHDVGRPSFYMLHVTTGEPTDGRVESGSPIPAGETASFDISLEGVEIPDIGAIVLLLGRDNYGLFVRTA